MVETLYTPRWPGDRLRWGDVSSSVPRSALDIVALCSYSSIALAALKSAVLISTVRGFPEANARGLRKLLREALLAEDLQVVRMGIDYSC